MDVIWGVPGMISQMGFIATGDPVRLQRFVWECFGEGRMRGYANGGGEASRGKALPNGSFAGEEVSSCGGG